MHGIGGTSGINRSFSGEAPGSPKSPRDRGFSFGAKERTKHEKSTISIRYHGPLAAIEAMGTEGPGPAQYDVRGIAAKSGRSPSPTSKFGTGTRDGGSKVFISR